MGTDSARSLRGSRHLIRGPKLEDPAVLSQQVSILVRLPSSARSSPRSYATLVSVARVVGKNLNKY